MLASATQTRHSPSEKCIRRQERYDACAPGEIFRPRSLPAGIWMQVDKFENSPVARDLVDYFAIAEDRARGLFCFPPMESSFDWRCSGQTHPIRRIGYPLTHAHYLTSTASQGQTIRTGLTIDCARQEQRGARGASDHEWWLHLYVMFSRATCMDDMLLLRPPPRELLERGPPPSVVKALKQFDERMATEALEIIELARLRGWHLPHQ